MSISRRQFLLSTAGAAVGAIIPSFYFRALEYLEQFGQPLLEIPRSATSDLWVVDYGDFLEFSLGDPCEAPPPTTYRQYFENQGFDDLESCIADWELEPEDLEREIDPEFVLDRWGMHGGPTASAYHLLDSLDLGTDLVGPNAAGGIDLYTESNMVSQWLSARPRDQVTLSLLQQRLNDLGTGVRLVTGHVM